MRLSKKYFMVVGVVVAIIATIAFIKRDEIAGLILKGSDTSLTGEAAQSSPQAKLALDFIAALRAGDMNTLKQLTTAKQAAHLQREVQQPSADFQAVKAMMLEDLPINPIELSSKIKYVQTHEDRGVVTFETQANSWFVLLRNVDGMWKVNEF